MLYILKNISMQVDTCSSKRVQLWADSLHTQNIIYET